MQFDDTVLGARSITAMKELDGSVYIVIAFETTSPSSQSTILQLMVSSHLVTDPYQLEVETLEQDVVVREVCENIQIKGVNYLFLFFTLSLFFPSHLFVWLVGLLVSLSVSSVIHWFVRITYNDSNYIQYL